MARSIWQSRLGSWGQSWGQLTQNGMPTESRLVSLAELFRRSPAVQFYRLSNSLPNDSLNRFIPSLIETNGTYPKSSFAREISK